MKSLIEKYKNLFPEEAFYAGLKDDDRFHTGDIEFSTKFSKHLDFYEKNLYPYLAERLYKAATFLFYSIVGGRKLTNSDKNCLEALLEGHVNTNSEVDRLALDYFKGLLEVYDPFVTEDVLKQLERTLSASKRISERVILPTPFEVWLKQLYGLDVLPEEVVVEDIGSLNKDVVENQIALKVSLNSFEPLQLFVNLLCSELGVAALDVTFQEVPEYMKPALPLAGAYWFDRLHNDTRGFKVLVNKVQNFSLAKLVLVISHEVLGHILQFTLVSKHCEDNAKKLPYLSRFPLTEGVALLAETMAVELLENDSLGREVLSIFGLDSSLVPKFKSELEQSYKKALLLRCARYLFELEVYQNGTSPNKAVHNVAKLVPFSREELHDDLCSFLFTPGYGSCYLGGLKHLEGRINLREEQDRTKLGKLGFAFIDGI
jgi:hypothetical protein